MNKRILLIEDNTAVRENTAEILELAGYDVITAVNGKFGVEIAQTQTPDLIICDIMMPELDGYGVLHMLGKNPKTATTPFIILTAKSERNDLRKGMELGADDYITKPFDDIELLKAVERRLLKQEAIRSALRHDSGRLDVFLSQARGLEELSTILEDMRVRNFQKKEFIYHVGSLPDMLYLIEKGRIKTYQMDESGKEFITGLYGHGDYIGYTALLKNEPHPDTAEAMEDTEVREIPKSDFEELLFRNPDVSRKFIGLLANDVAEKEEQLLNLAYNSVRKRVANALLTLQLRYGFSDPDRKGSSIKISREDLANIVGTATESVIRALAEMKHDGLIEINGGEIAILSPQKLAALRW